MQKCKLCGQEMTQEIIAKIAADDAKCEGKNALYAEAIEKWDILYSFSGFKALLCSIFQASILVVPVILAREINPELIGFGLIVGIAGVILSIMVFLRIEKDRKHYAKKKMEIEYPKLFSILESKEFSF